jgi:hypothetical protein
MRSATAARRRGRAADARSRDARDPHEAPPTSARSRLAPSAIVGSCLALVAWLLPSPARAESTTSSARRAHAARLQEQPYTTVELGTGLLALPAATVCPNSPTDCSTGEISLGLGIRNLYQFGPIGVGAGITWGTTLRNDEARGADDLLREHSRRYFLVEGLFRYSVLQHEDAEAWLGGGLGLVTIRDAWTVDADRNPPSDTQFVGPEALDIRTEGLSATIAGGGSWFFADNFSVGGLLRYGNWVLPFEPETSPVGDVASLSGRVDMFELQFTAAYRLAL